LIVRPLIRGRIAADAHHADRQAVEDAEAIEEPLHFARRGREGVLGALVPDEQGATVYEQSSRGA
jgi:hypothetical protein